MSTPHERIIEILERTMTTISKTTFEFTVLHPTDQPPESLEDALAGSDTGNMVGNTTSQVTEPIYDDEVPSQLRLLGNDGEFFDDELETDNNTKSEEDA